MVDFRLSVGIAEALSFSVGGDIRLREMVELLIHWEEGAVAQPRQKYERLFWKLPLGVGLVWPELVRADGAEKIVRQLKGADLLDGAPRVSTYKGVQIQRLPIAAKRYRELAAFLDLAGQQAPQSPFVPVLSVLPRQEAPAALHVAVIDEAMQVSANEAFLKQLIDRAEARKKAGKKPTPPSGEAHAALSLEPGHAREAASLFLEYEGHCLALLNNQVWNGFYQAGLLAPGATEAARKETCAPLPGLRSRAAPTVLPAAMTPGFVRS